MKRNLMVLALAALGLASCNGGFKQDEGGLLYQIHVDKDGPKIQAGDFVSLNLVAKREDDSVMFSTYEAGHPVQTIVPKPQFKGDIFAGLTKLAEGDSATIKICADSMFKKGQPKPPGFKGKYLVYTVKVEKLVSKGKLSDQIFNDRITAYMKSEGEAFKKQEPAKIEKYIAHEKLNVTKTADGLNYQITKPGDGVKPVVGDTVVVNYTGRLLNGKIFDSSVKDSVVKAKIPADPMRPYKPIHIPVGEKRVIPGWDEGLLLLSKGSQAVFVIPSSLAYGERGVSIIGPYTPIAFEVELVDIIKPNPNAPKPTAALPPPAAPAKK